jgi:sugar phosphate isomerase/epimerase
MAISRREFLGTAAASAAWSGVDVGAADGERRTDGHGPAVQGGHASAPLQLGVASYSLREFPLEQALEMARTESPEETRARRAKIEAAGITIMGGGTITLPNDPALIRKDFEYAKNAGFPLIFITADREALDTIEAMAKEFDIKVAIHNHGPEDKRWPRPQDAYAAIKSRDRRMGLCIDVGHTLRTGTDPVEACRACRDRLYDMHVKDLSVKTDRDSQVAVGRGVMDIPALFRTLIKIGYKGQVGLEYEIKPKDPLPGMIESIAYQRGVLAALATA